MAEPTFDHELQDAYRPSIDYVVFSCQLAKSPVAGNGSARGQWLRAAQSIPLNIAHGDGKQSLNYETFLKLLGDQVCIARRFVIF
jgi:four helix bundle protein